MPRRARRILVPLWRRLAGGLQWRLLHATQATFMVGVSALLEDEDGRILVIRHAFWPAGKQWGLPTGYLEREESLADCVRRELVEELGGGEIGEIRIIDVRAGRKLRVEILVGAPLLEPPAASGHASVEVLGHRLVMADALPEEMHPGHVEKVALGRATG